MGYDYRNLSPIEFERLCCDLLSLKDNVRYQRFGEGRDDGVDLMFEASSGDRTVVQCKRYCTTSQLINVLKRTEAKKVQKLKPRRYFLLTTAHLSPGNKDDILKIFSPYMEGTQDIFGCEEIDDLLDNAAYREVVYNIPSLWISSFKLVSEFVNNGVLGRSTSELEEYIRAGQRLAWTSMCDIGMKVVETTHSVIFVGDPGIGKTVSAKMLLCRLHLMGYKVVVSYGYIRDFEDVYLPEEKQVFFLDDFLGSNYFDAITGREDSQICQFMRRVERDSNKRFILTSRTTILKRGIECSLAFKAYGLNQKSRLVDVNEISCTDKAHILYKSLSESQCSDDVLHDFVRQKSYWPIIKHRNFSPRVIDFILGAGDVKKTGSGSMLEIQLKSALDSPMAVWGSVYNKQISPIERVLVWMSYLGGGVSECRLNEAFDRISLLPLFQKKDNDLRTFRSVTETLVGSLLKRTRNFAQASHAKTKDQFDGENELLKAKSDEVTYQLQNHSITDFLAECWSDDEVSVKIAIEQLGEERAIVEFLKFASNQISENKKVANVLRYLAEEGSKTGRIQFALKAYSELIRYDIESIGDALRIIDGLGETLSQKVAIGTLIHILDAAEDHGYSIVSVINFIKASGVERLLRDCDNFHDAIKLYHMVVRYTGYEPENASETLSELIVEFACNEINGFDEPSFEYNESSGYLEPTRAEITRCEELLYDRIRELLIDTRTPSHLIDIRDCVEQADVREMFKRDPDSEINQDQYGSERSMNDMEIENMFSNLRRSE